MSHFGTEYFLISVKTSNERNTLEHCYQALRNLASVHQFHIPDLKVGTLDSLMSLSDELAKHDTYIESVIKRLSQQILQTINNEFDKIAEALRIYEQNIDDYVKKFKWDLAKYPIKQSLKNLVEIVIKMVSQVESDLKTKHAHYNKINSTLTTLQKRNSGGLMTRSLNDIVKKDDFIQDSKFMKTILVVVPKAGFTHWWTDYETLIPMVVPRSSRMIYEDNESGLVTVVVFVKFIQEFKDKAKENGFNVRDYEFNEEMIKKEKIEYAKLQTEKERTFSIFTRWLKISFSDAFIGWFHVKAIRVFVESVLRYGLPVSFKAILIEPLHKNHKKIREILKGLYADMDRKGIDILPEDLKNDDTVGVDALNLIDHGEYFPYVSFTLKTKLIEHSLLSY